MLLYFILIVSVLGLIGCSSNLKIQSEPPNVDVYAALQKSAEKKLIGKTPFEITFDQLGKNVGTVESNEFYTLFFESKELEPEKVLLPNRVFGTDKVDVFVKLTPKKEIGLAREALQRMHNAQKFAVSGQYERSLVEIDKVLEFDGKFVRAHSLKGSVFYLQKNFDEALKWFESALAIDNTFEEAIKMISKIKAEKEKK